MKLRPILLAIPISLSVLAGPAFAQRMGDYDSHHVWHDADWWHKNNPAWMREHHPEWAKNHPEWQRNEHHHDRDRDRHDHHDDH